MPTLKYLLLPQRLRQVPRQFSWIDQRLVRDGLIERCDPWAGALYLLLVTVGDAQGLSYYGEARLCRYLHLSLAQLGLARQRLIDADLVAFRAPLYQVLSLPASVVSASKGSAGEPVDRRQAREHLRGLREQIGGRRG